MHSGAKNDTNKRFPVVKIYAKIISKYMIPTYAALVGAWGVAL